MPPELRYGKRVIDCVQHKLAMLNFVDLHRHWTNNSFTIFGLQPSQPALQCGSLIWNQAT
jgi:hypothetical protein